MFSSQNAVEDVPSIPTSVLDWLALPLSDAAVAALNANESTATFSTATIAKPELFAHAARTLVDVLGWVDLEAHRVPILKLLSLAYMPGLLIF